MEEVVQAKPIPGKIITVDGKPVFIPEKETTEKSHKLKRNIFQNIMVQIQNFFKKIWDKCLQMCKGMVDKTKNLIVNMIKKFIASILGFTKHEKTHSD